MTSPNVSKRRVLIAGAGEAGSRAAREMLRHPEGGLVPVGFLDDDPLKQNQTIAGLPVLGPIDALPTVARQVAADEVLIAMPSAPGRVVRTIVHLAQGVGLGYRILPGTYDILTGRVEVSPIRNVELEDLLRREPVHLDLATIASYLQGRVVLITGAGGSIGSQILREIVPFQPRQVLLVGHGENSLFTLEEEISFRWPHLPNRLLVADVRDQERMEHLFRVYRPAVVFHAAAHKHVPLMEHNPDEAVFNNVRGTHIVAELALRYGVERFVNISTDKAVNPTSVMGATKRVAEMVVAWLSRRAQEGQAFVSVRFGNVLGSRGSVVPHFQKQIRRGGPVTITHPQMTRYFMTTSEAAQLVVQAGGLAENGALYVLDMGEPVRIVDLAHDLIRLSGLEPGIDIEIVFIGPRPGEKLHEELWSAEERVSPSPHPKILRVSSPQPPPHFAHLLEALFQTARERDYPAIQDALKQLVPSYQPASPQVATP
ncbi:MAG: polysaccharide biosynthesis protein [Dehalococcoidia bacterium]|nr:polysaccharide biosynthesis protein [Dehalococcoidia bacterium]